MTLEEAKALIRDIPDFPHPGILFRDLTPLLAVPAATEVVLAALEAWARPLAPTLVAAIEARGFIFGGALAARLGVGFAPIRKPGKLPFETYEESYGLEYGTDRLQIHRDAAPAGSRVVVVDDLLATGGTAAAAARLVERCGGEVAGFGFVVELTALDGRRALEGMRVESLIRF